MHYKKIMCAILAIHTMVPVLFAQQDTLKINYKQAEAILLKDNLSLLSSYYDVKISEAQVIQAKAWVNPYLHWNQDMYSVEKNAYFAYRRQALVQIDQTFSIAGKHTNTVKLAKVSVEINKLMLQDISRSLIFELGILFNELSALQKKQAIYTDVLRKYSDRISAGEKMLSVGSMAGNEILRLKSELIALQTTTLQNNNQIVEVMGKLKILLNFKPEIYLIADQSDLVTEPAVILADLYNNAILFRPDYQLALKNIQYSETNLRLQQSIAVPDINVGYQPLDRGSNYVRTYHGLVVEFSLPFLNRNNGNIQSAKWSVQKAETQKNLKENQLNNEINSSYLQWLYTGDCLKNYTDSFLNNIEKLNENANYNYNKKNISMLEFIDLQRIYLENKLQHIDLINQYRQSSIQLNFVVGKETITQ